MRRHRRFITRCSSDLDPVTRDTGSVVSLFPHGANGIETVRQAPCEVVQEEPVPIGPGRLRSADCYRHVAEMHLPPGQLRAPVRWTAHFAVSQGSPHAYSSGGPLPVRSMTSKPETGGNPVASKARSRFTWPLARLHSALPQCGSMEIMLGAAPPPKKVLPLLRHHSQRLMASNPKIGGRSGAASSRQNMKRSLSASAVRAIQTRSSSDTAAAPGPCGARTCPAVATSRSGTTSVRGSSRRTPAGIGTSIGSSLSRSLRLILTATGSSSNGSRSGDRPATIWTRRARVSPSMLTHWTTFPGETIGPVS